MNISSHSIEPIIENVGFDIKPYFTTEMGRSYLGLSENVLKGLSEYNGKIQLILTSPPFPLKRKKKYGNLDGEKYVNWLANYANIFKEFLTPDGSIVIELGNAWNEGSPTMSTLPIESLLNFCKVGNYRLCQEFICYNPARLPTPAQWVTIERVRVKDAFTRLWWLSSTDYPKADNRNVLVEYSKDMKKLLYNKKYNAGKRPSEHVINDKSFLKDNRGAIAPNVIISANTSSCDPYLKYCKANNINLHPCRMSTELAEFFIKFLTSEGDLVLDPFAGSNVVGAKSEELKRRWIAIEAQEEYIKGSLGRFNIS
ncbi:MAG: putative methyltransferase [Methanocella sp. PtaU1.Bin125]|nr:MAG: putative methyltransferase [Methanocella sp. PtaU1.Bin125]